MGEEVVEYVHLPAGSDLPNITRQPRRTIILVEQECEVGWQERVSDWIVESGCLYMMAWGRDCTSWDDSVDYAMHRKAGYADVSDDNFVVTTWHDGEPLHEVFFFARMCAFHPEIALPTLTIVDIRAEARKVAVLALHEAESAGLLEDAFENPRNLSLVDRLKILMRTR